jgi:hypothetical protein
LHERIDCRSRLRGALLNHIERALAIDGVNPVNQRHYLFDFIGLEMTNEMHEKITAQVRSFLEYLLHSILADIFDPKIDHRLNNLGWMGFGNNNYPYRVGCAARASRNSADSVTKKSVTLGKRGAIHVAAKPDNVAKFQIIR